MCLTTCSSSKISSREQIFQKGFQYILSAHDTNSVYLIVITTNSDVTTNTIHWTDISDDYFHVRVFEGDRASPTPCPSNRSIDFSRNVLYATTIIMAPAHCWCLFYTETSWYPGENVHMMLDFTPTRNGVGRPNFRIKTSQEESKIIESSRFIAENFKLRLEKLL